MHRLLAGVFAASALALCCASPATAADQQFTLTADFVGLYPNAHVTVPVTVHNPNDFDLAVHTATVEVQDASPACPSTNLEAASFVGDVVVRAGGDGVVPLRMHMPSSAPDACQGASFPLVFTASATSLSDSASGGSGGFAFTGAESSTLAAAGVGAIAIGWLLTRRRDRTARA
jgi:hypothetical protein